jgi:hypothetical protein
MAKPVQHVLAQQGHPALQGYQGPPRSERSKIRLQTHLQIREAQDPNETYLVVLHH